MKMGISGITKFKVTLCYLASGKCPGYLFRDSKYTVTELFAEVFYCSRIFRALYLFIDEVTAKLTHNCSYIHNLNNICFC